MKHTIKNRTHQLGFTLIEIIIALMIIGALAGISLRFFAGIIDMIQRQDTKHTMDKLEDSFRTMFKNSSSVIAATDAAYPFAFRIIPASSTKTEYAGIAPNAFYDGGSMMTGPDNAKKCISNGGFNTLANLPTIASTATNQGYWSAAGLATGLTTGTPNSVTYDGWNRPFCIMVSQPISETKGEITISYRTVVIISSGANGIISPNHTFNALTGILSFDNKTDDEMRKISGSEAAGLAAEEVKKKLDKVVGVYENYFRTRFLSNPQRDAFKNYFAYSRNSNSDIRNQWDTSAGAVIPVSGEITGDVNQAVSLLKTDSQRNNKPIYESMGLSKTDVVIGETEEDVIYLDNSSSLVRNPLNNSSSGNMSTPPYTASFFVCLEAIDKCRAEPSKFIKKTLVGSF